ncbi:phage tail fiber protein [Escherichia coli]|uniref:phage tail fiber domain-containing protein n=1 Tax=Escherichia coli TaxID=562 RepID=UPI003D1E2077
MSTTYNNYTGDGSTVAYTYTFSVSNNSAINVYVGGALQTTGYSINTVLKAVIFDTAPAAGVSILLVRVTDLDNLNKFGQGAAFTGTNLDENFSIITDVAQEAYDTAQRTSGLALRVAASEGSIDEIPSAATRKGKLLGFHGTTAQPVAIPPESGTASDVLLLLSSPEGAGLIGTESGDTLASADLHLRTDLASTGADKGSALVATVQPYADAVARSQAAVNAQVVSIKDFLGDEYSGASDASQGFTEANAQVPKSVRILVPAGNYRLDSDVDCVGRHFLFEEPVNFTGTGYLKRAVIHRIDGTTGAISVGNEGVRGSDSYPQYGSNYKFGNTAGNVSGLQVGGGVPINGTYGNVFFADGYSSWTSIQPSRYPSPAELAVQPASLAGNCTMNAGTNVVTVLSGPGLRTEDVGKTIWIRDSGYTVLSVASGSFTVKNLDNSPVSFPSTASATYLCCYIWGRGKCNVNGKNITRVSGDPFVPLNNIPTTFVVNGVTTVQDGYTDSWHATLAASAGTANGVDYYWWGSVDNLAAAIRVHRCTGAGFEENLSIIASSRGFYHIHAAGGNNFQYPIYLGTGYDPDGLARRQITLDGVNGIVTIGGYYGRAAAEFGYRTFSTGDVNRFRFDSATSGNSPAFTAVGPDANINTIVAAKGTGFIRVDSELRFNAAIYPHLDNTYTVGRSGLRPSSIWAANGTIQTSDGTMKTDINDCDLATEFIKGLHPVSYKFIDGGNTLTEVDDGYEEVQRQVTELVNKSEEVNETVTVDGVTKIVRRYKTVVVESPVFDSVPVVDEHGNFLEMASVPRMETVRVPKRKTVVTPVAGKRTHYGLIAQEVKALLDKLGIDDFGGYVVGEDGRLGLRYEQFIAPIVATLQDILKRIEQLESK